VSAAFLDRARQYAEYNGGVSDPRLIDQIGPVTPITPEQEASVRRLLRDAFPDPIDVEHRDELLAMLLDGTKVTDNPTILDTPERLTPNDR
jgi:hypothetical protein